MPNLAVFASGSGTNAENLMNVFQNSSLHISRIFCNNPNADVITRANNFSIPVTIFSKQDFYESDFILKQLQSESIDFIILAGFLWLIPDYLTTNYNKKIINIHPALLPKYGGKGMYGMHVHRAVIANKEKESGITIHLVDEVYDNGKILFNATCTITETDTPESLAQKVHELEYSYFPTIVKDYVINYPTNV